MTALGSITLPGTDRSLVEAGCVRQVEVDGATVRVLLAVPTGNPADGDAVRADAVRVLEATEEVEKAIVEAKVLSPPPDSEAPAVGSQQAPAWADRLADIRHVIAVASGKGGVGKSTVAANLALGLARLGRGVGLLDADIYGPSQQIMLGGGQPMGDPSGKILPIKAVGGVKVMSLGMIIDADQPVIWRGPMLMKALEQFIGDVLWGELDDLVVDLPPGTGDVALTLCQNVPLAGAVIVTTPQDVALIDARKALLMFRKLGVPVLGLIENMAHFTCPSCGHVEHIFGSGGGLRTARELDIPFLGEIPIDSAIVAGGDSGRPIVVERPDSPASQAFQELARQVAEQLS
jgi:ATP-binding protein involved in chromosome partitioning